MRVPSLLVVTAAVVLAGCNKNNPSPQAGGQAQVSGDTVVATIGAQKVTAAELDERVQDKIFQLRKQALDQLIVERLVKVEAQKAGKSEEDFLKGEIDAKVPPPPEAQVKEMYEKNKAQLPANTSLDDFRQQIVDYITRPERQKRAQALFEELRQKGEVKVLLTEPRKKVEAKGPAKGPEAAKVTIVEFSDFQCPFCSRAMETVDQVMQAYEGKVRLVFRHFPLDFHPQAQKAAEASLCANEQGKFWEYHDHLFKNQDKLQVDQLKAHAKTLSLDEKKFTDCLDGGKQATTVKSDMEAGKKVGVTGTPAFFINGVMLSGAQPIGEFKRVIDQELQGNL